MPTTLEQLPQGIHIHEYKRMGTCIFRGFTVIKISYCAISFQLPCSEIGKFPYVSVIGPLCNDLYR